MFRSDSVLCLWSNVDTHAVVDLQGFQSTSGSGRLVPRTAVRLVDTRPADALDAGQVLQIPVIGDGKARAGTTTVALNVAVDDPQRAGFLTVYPCGTNRPWAANLNFAAGQTMSNEVMVQPGADGMVCVYTTAATQLVVDLNATYDAAALASFTPLVSGRLADTRSTTKVLGGETVELHIVSATGAPTGTTALSLNIAVTEPEAAGLPHRVPVQRDHAIGGEPQLRRRSDDQQPRDGNGERRRQDLRLRQPHHPGGGRRRGHLSTGLRASLGSHGQRSRSRSERQPGLEPADQVGGAMQTDVVEGGGGEAGAIPLVAHEHDAVVVARHLRDAMVGQRVESPFECVSFDHHCPRELAVASALLDRSDVDDQRSRVAFCRQSLRRHAVQTGLAPPRGGSSTPPWVPRRRRYGSLPIARVSDVHRPALTR